MALAICLSRRAAMRISSGVAAPLLGFGGGEHLFHNAAAPAAALGGRPFSLFGFRGGEHLFHNAVAPAAALGGRPFSLFGFRGGVHLVHNAAGGRPFSSATGASAGNCNNHVAGLSEEMTLVVDGNLDDIRKLNESQWKVTRNFLIRVVISAVIGAILLVLGGGYAGAMYFKDKGIKEAELMITKVMAEFMEQAKAEAEAIIAKTKADAEEMAEVMMVKARGHAEEVADEIMKKARVQAEEMAEEMLNKARAHAKEVAQEIVTKTKSRLSPLASALIFREAKSRPKKKNHP